MKKSLLSLLSIFLIISLCSYGTAKIFGTKDNTNDKHTIVSSFYPEYIILLNLLDNCEDIHIKNMTSAATGCLHDYQLTSADMKVLEHADGFVINGGGMEPFLDDVTKAYPKLHVIDSSNNIEFLENISSHDHEETTDICKKDHKHNDDCNVKDSDTCTKDHKHNDDCNIKDSDTCTKDHKHNDNCYDEEQIHTDSCTVTEHVHTADCDHGKYNAHIWLNPSNYIKQIHNISRELCTIYPEHKDVINKNSSLYTQKIESLQSDINKLNKRIRKQDKKDIIIFHDSFAYIADSFNLNVIQCIEVESDSSLSAGTIASTIDEINLHNITILLSEKQFKTTIADNIAKETDAKVYVLDSLVTGTTTKDSYINGMKKNIASIENIFK